MVIWMMRWVAWLGNELMNKDRFFGELIVLLSDVKLWLIPNPE